MMTKPVTTTIAALALAGLLGVGCGDGGDDDVASASDDDSGEQAQGDDAAAEEELLDWVECMRDAGVDIPEPTRDEDGNLVIGGGEGGSGGTVNGAAGAAGDEPAFDPEDMNPEEMAAAQEECGDPPALGAGDISEEDRQAQQQAALDFSQCMRDEGIEDFPDPDFSDEGPGGEPQAQEDEAEPGDEGDDDVFMGPFGEIDMHDPEVAAAFEACQHLMGPRPAGAAPSDEGSDA